MKSKKTFAYAAFICHAPADRRVAKRLLRQLEQLKVPTGFSDRKSQKFRPVFLPVDKTEEKKVDELAAIADSAELVVICSPAACESQSVEKQLLLLIY